MVTMLVLRSFSPPHRELWRTSREFFASDEIRSSRCRFFGARFSRGFPKLERAHDGGGGNIAAECANKRKMTVGSWPYWREVGKRRAIRDSSTPILSEFISEGKVSRRRRRRRLVQPRVEGLSGKGRRVCVCL